MLKPKPYDSLAEIFDVYIDCPGIVVSRVQIRAEYTFSHPPSTS